jgi:hypothetical protein
MDIRPAGYEPGISSGGVESEKDRPAGQKGDDALGDLPEDDIGYSQDDDVTSDNGHLKVAELTSSGPGPVLGGRVRLAEAGRDGAALEVGRDAHAHFAARANDSHDQCILFHKALLPSNDPNIGPCVRPDYMGAQDWSTGRPLAE